MDIKTLLKRDAIRQQQNYAAYNDYLILQQIEEQARYLRQKLAEKDAIKDLIEKDDLENEVREKPKQDVLEENKGAIITTPIKKQTYEQKPVKRQNAQLEKVKLPNLLKQSFDSIGNLKKWFTVLGLDGQVRNYYKTPKELESDRLNISNIPTMQRTQEANDYYLQLSPEYIERAKELYNIAQAHKEAQEEAQSDKEWFKRGMVLKSLFQELLSTPMTNPMTTPYLPSGSLYYKNEYEGLTGHVYLKMQDPGYLNDAFASYVIKKNTVEVETDAGNIIMADEARQYVNKIQQYLQAALQYSDGYYSQLSNGQNTLNPESVSSMKDAVEKIKQMRDDIEEALSYSFRSLEAFKGSEKLRLLINMFDNLTKDGLPKSTDLAFQLKKLITSINRSYSEFLNDLDEKEESWKDRAERNLTELRKWQAWHTPSAEYQAKEQAAQENLLLDFDTYAYSMPGVMGSSASFNGIQILGTALNWIGQAVAAIPNPYTKAAGGLLIGGGAVSNIAAGNYENSAEVALNYKDGLKSRLQKKNLYDKFINEGKKQLREKNESFTNDDEVLDAFLLKKWFTDNKEIRDEARKLLFGANNLYWNDMMATTADVVFDTGLSMFAPYGPLSKTTKYTPIPKTAALERLYRMRGLNTMSAAIHNFSKESGVGRYMFGSMSPLSNLTYRSLRAAATPVTEAISNFTKPFAKQLGEHLNNIVGFSKIAPTKLFTKALSNKGVDFAGRLIAQGFSEAIEEGKQHTFGERYAKGELAGRSKSILDILMDDLSVGVSSGFTFLGHQLLGLKADKDLMAEMRGGFLGGLLNMNTAIFAARTGYGMYKDVLASDLVYNNLLAEKYKGRSAILNAETFAKYNTRSDYDRMMETFDRFKEVLSPIREERRVGFTDEDIERQREEYKKIYKASNSAFTQTLALSRGIAPKSDRYRTFVALAHYIDEERQDLIKDYQTDVNAANQILSDYNISPQQLDNLEDIIDNGLLDPTLTDRQRKYLEELLLTLLQNNPGLTGRYLVNAMRNSINLRKSIDRIFAEYTVLRQLNDEMNLLRDSSPEEYHNQRKKAEIYKEMLKTFLAKNPGVMDPYEDGSLDLSEIRDAEVSDVELYDNLTTIFRSLKVKEAALLDLENVWMNLVGSDTYGELFFDLYSPVTEGELGQILERAHNEYKHSRKRIKSADKENNKKNPALDLIDQYLNSVKSDEEFVETINRDFREAQEAHKKNATESFYEQNQEDVLSFNPFEQQAADLQESKKVDNAVKQFLDTVDKKDRRKYKLDLGGFDTEDLSRALQAVSLYEEGASVSENTKDHITMLDEDGAFTVPINKRFTHVATRLDGTRVFLTEVQAKFIKYLNDVNDQIEQSIPQKETVDVAEFKDRLMLALLEDDKDTFDSILLYIKPYISEDEYTNFLLLWQDRKERPTSLVLVTKQATEPPKRDELDKKVRRSINASLSVISILHHYSNAIPTQDELDEHLLKYLDTIAEEDRKNTSKKLNQKKDDVTRLHQVEFYVKAGFTISSRRTARSTVYEAVAPTGESYKITKDQYNYAAWLLFYKDRTNTVTLTPPIIPEGSNDRLKAVLELLKTKLAEQNPAIIRNDLRTGLDYFIVENGHLVRYGRVHSYLNPQYEKYSLWKKDFAAIVDDLTAVFDDKEAYKQRVIYYENRFNDALAEQYGLTSDTYKRHHINLSAYLTDDIITDKESILSIAHIAAIKKHTDGKIELDIPGRAVIAGDILDNICRTFFSGKSVLNDPKWGIDQEVFNRLISDLNHQLDVYTSRGWVLSTEPYCWYCTLPDGRRIAGETDMIAVDEEGGIHIIDFKTSKYSFRQEQYKYSDPLRGDTWFDVTPSLVEDGTIPADAERRLFNVALDNTTRTQSRSARSYYEDQQTAYANMIRVGFEGKVEVKSIELLTFDVKTRAGINTASGVRDENVFGGFARADEDTMSRDDDNQRVHADAIEFQGSVELSFSKDINRLFIEKEDTKAQRDALSTITQTYNTVFERVNSLFINDNQKISTESKSEFDKILSVVRVLASRSVNQNILDDKESIETLINDILTLLTRLESLETAVNEEIIKYDENHPQVVSNPGGRKLNPNRKAALGETQKFNCLDFFDSNYVNKDLLRVSANPDFLESAIFEIDVDSYEKSRVILGRRVATPTVFVTIHYDEHLADGTVKHHVFDKIRLLLAKTDQNGNPYSYGLDGNNTSPLLAKIESIIANPENKGKSVILTKGNRTNGTVLSTVFKKPMQDVFNLSDEDMELCLSGTSSGSVIGIIKRGSLYKTSSERGTLIPLHGIVPERALTDGMVYWYFNLGYNEDNGSGQHSIPLPLIPKALTESDAKFIIDLLKNFTKKRNITINGKEYKCPITNSRLLRTIIRFGRGAEETGSRFIFNWANVDEKGFSTDLYRTVRIAKRNAQDRSKFDYDHIIDLHDDQQVLMLQDLLVRDYYVYANNEYAMWHATSSSRDASNNNASASLSNPFVGLELFFKSNPELTQGSEDVVIEFSESFKFRRSDVDPDLDGSYRGITGIHWMMKNNWLLSDFSGVILPLVAFDDVEVSKKITEPEQNVFTDPSEQPVSENNAEDEWANAGDPWIDGSSFEFKLQNKPAEKPIDRKAAEKHLRHILGNSFTVEFLDKAYEVFTSGWIAVAGCKVDSIILTDYAENGVEFHEAFHAVVDLLMGESRRKALYKHYLERYGGTKKLSDTEISEGLADMYYEFRMNTPILLSWNILKTFKQIKNWVTQLYNLNDRKLAWLFVLTNLGYFRNRKPDPKSIESFNKRNGGRKILFYTVKDSKNNDVEFKQFTSFRQFDDAIDGILYRIIRDYGIDNLATNIDRLRTDKKSLTAEDSKFAKTYNRLTMPNKTDEQIEEAANTGKISQIAKMKLLQYREIFDKWDVSERYIEQKLKSLGIDTIRRRIEANKKDADGGSVVQDMIDLGNGEFYTHARSEDISVQVRYFLSTVPSVRWLTEEDIQAGLLDTNGNPYTSIYRKDKDGNTIYDEKGKPVRIQVAMSRNTMGEITFLKFLKVYLKVLKNLYDVRDVQDLLDRLDVLGDSDYVFYHIKKSLYSFRSKSYVRYDKNKLKEKDYANIPKVLYNGLLLHPRDYVQNLSNPTEKELYPTQVRYSHDIINEETGEIEHRAGDIIEGAVIITDPDYESITTQVFLAIKSQKLNFVFTYEQPIIDENGEVVAGRHKYSVASTTYQADVRAYPILWFNRLRNLSTGIFKDEDGVAVIDKTSENANVFGEVKNFLSTLLASFAPNLRHKIELPGGSKKYDIDNPEDFDKIITLFVSNLNRVGIMIDKSSLLYHFMLQNVPMVASFEDIFTTNEERSISTFILNGGVLDKLQAAVNNGATEVFTQDENSVANKKTGQKGNRSGSYLYSLNGFVSSMASLFSNYRSASQEIMVLGPDNTRMYTFAQNHSISDFTYELNDALDEDGNVVEDNIMHDLKDVVYVGMETERGRIGSIIAKRVLDRAFNPNKNRLKLCTSAGVKTKESKTGGTKYAEITSRDDFLSKVSIIKQGGIVFPTLSDKSTWFYLSGIQLPGLNWECDQIEEFGIIPTVGLLSGRLFFDNNDTVGDFKANPVLDQMIEYAMCELANIEKTINDLGLNQDLDSASQEVLSEEKKIANYHKLGKPDDKGNYKDAGLHGARFFFLTGVYDERTGEYIEFNKLIKSDKDLGALKCYLLAKLYFFDKVINPKTGQLETDEELKCRQRSLMAAILLRRLDETLDYLVEKGMIDYDQRQTKYHVDRSHSTPSRVKDNLPKYFGYVNKYLDDLDIQFIADIYYQRFNGKYSVDQCRSLAIVAYMFDINNKSIMSMEETERIYTGFPQFFGCRYDKEGHLVDRGEDESKRYGGAGSTGSNNRQDLPNIPSEYTCAEIKDWKVKSSLFDTLAPAFRLDEYRDALATRRVDLLRDSDQYSLEAEKQIYDEVYSMKQEQLEAEFSESERRLIEAKISAEVRSYDSGINVADGTAYITDKMAENLLRQRGAYIGKVKEAFEYLRNHKKATYTVVDEKDNTKRKEVKINKKNGYLTSSKAYRIIHDALISTQKYSAYGFRMENQLAVHFYNKYALFPLFEGISYGFTHSLYEKMNDPENPVDMVMFESAVKTGQEGGLKFNPDMSEEEIKAFSFKGHTYKQKYKFIRRQLNTDPRIEEIMAIGTQALKIALTTLKDGLMYTLRDGSQVLGAGVKTMIMDILKELSDIGVENIRGKLLRSGSEVQSLSDFLKDQLLSRSADKNILDALDVIEDPETHEKRFKVDINAVSNAAWAESILASMINDEVIDVNTPGNAYYQRSVFGMEGPVIMTDEDLKNSKTDYLVNGGNELLMINEKGSMDAIISIDFFMHIIPAKYRYNFQKARLWLIDNKIIGPDADANILSYRIPTQAVSSVHALRIVDVLPTIRDTIVLPREFTSITGSDFDIDKLYLSALNYRLDGENATTEFEYGSKKYLLNKLISTYLTILEDAGKQVNSGEITKSRYIHMLFRSIDNDTELATSVLAKIEERVKPKVYEPMLFGCLYRQVEIKNAFITGKFGIGPFALNVTSHVLTMLYNVHFAKKEHGILDIINCRSLGKSLDRDGNSIMSWLSAMINLHVDAAKDPKIIRMNVNTYTYNLTNLLLRTGLGQDALYFLGLPILKDLAQVYQNANGEIVEDPGLSPTQRFNRAEADYIVSLKFKDNTVAHMMRSLVNNNLSEDKRMYNWRREMVDTYRVGNEDIMKALFSVNESGEYKRQFETVNGVVEGKSILEDLLTNQDILIDPDAPVTFENLKDDAYYKIGEKYCSPKEMQAYIFLAKQLLDTYADALSDVVTYTKIDTKKQGINFQELLDYKRNYDRIHDAFEIARETGTIPNSMFDENLEKMLDDSFIDTKTQNGTLMLLEEILGNHMIHMQDQFQNIVSEVCTILNNRTKKTKKAVQRALLTYIKQKCINRVMADQNIEFRSMISGNNTLSARIDALKQKMISDKTGKYSDFIVNGIITNTLLDAIHPVPYTTAYGQEYYDILTLDNIQSDDEQRENDYIDSWQLLLESDDEEIRNIGNDLAIYAFMTSGDNIGFTKFFKYVPDSWRISSGYEQYVREMKEAFKSYSISVDGMPDSFFNISTDELIRNNWSNNDIVPIMQAYTKRNRTAAEIEATGQHGPVYVRNYTGKSVIYRDINAGNVEVNKTVSQVIAGIVVDNGKTKVTISMNKDTGEFPPYIKMRRQNASLRSADPYVLYKLVSTSQRIDEHGRVFEYPIYALTYPKGYTILASGQRYDFYEYERDDEYTHIFDPSIMVGDEYGDKLKEIVGLLEQYVDSYGLLPLYLDPVIDETEVKGIDENGNVYYNEAYDRILRDVYLTESRASEKKTFSTGVLYPNMPEFNKLPEHSVEPTMTYAGIGSRNIKDAVDPDTGEPIAAVIKEVASQLELIGYKLNSGGAEGSDTAFESGVTKSENKNIFTTRSARSRMYKIAREVHPKWRSLGAHAKSLHARNTAQVFGRDLDTPVDFVLCYTPDGAEADPRTGATERLTGYNRPNIPNTGGTGQAISMASMKGIPVINMANSGWRERLNQILGTVKPKQILLREDSDRFNTPELDRKVIESNRTILSNEELKLWNESGVGPNPRILVASEHTDPAFHVLQIIDVLEGKTQINKPRWIKITKEEYDTLPNSDRWMRKLPTGTTYFKKQAGSKLSAKDFNGMYLITKHDGLPMERLLKTKIPKLIHFSITGLGGTKYEPGVMKYNDLLDRIGDYIKMGLDPNTVTIRIDPILPGVTERRDIENIIRRASEMGIKRIRFSIMQVYADIVPFLNNLGYDVYKYYNKLDVDDLLKDPDAFKVRTGQNCIHCLPEVWDDISNFLLEMKDKYDITLGTCAMPMSKAGISKEGCLSVAAVNRMLGTSVEDKGKENNKQRIECSCFGGKFDMFRYSDKCASHCWYCYAHHLDDGALEYYNEDGTLKNTIYTLTGERLSGESVDNTQQTMRIWAGRNAENAHLSNISIRPVTLNFSNLKSTFPSSILFDSVERAFLYAKFLYAQLVHSKEFSNTAVLRTGELYDMAENILNERNLWDVKTLGKNQRLTDEELAYWNKISRQVMKWIIKESFRQNPTALSRLLATGDIEFVHDNGEKGTGGEWETEFPKILSEVRSELRQEGGNPLSLKQLAEGLQNKKHCNGE